MHAGVRDHDVVVLRALTDEARIIVVRCRAGAHAIVAARAAIQVDHHRLCAVEEAVIAEEIQQALGDFGLRISDGGFVA